jgi:hypothetical protein
MMLKICLIILYASGVIGAATSKQSFDDAAKCDAQRAIDTAQWQAMIDRGDEPGRVVSKCMTPEEFKKLLESSGVEKGRDDSI